MLMMYRNPNSSKSVLLRQNQSATPSSNQFLSTPHPNHPIHSGSIVRALLPELLSRYADSANLADHVSFRIRTNCSTSKAGTAHHEGQVLARALGSRAGGEALCARDPASLGGRSEDGVAADSELNRASASHVGLSRECRQLVLCAWAESQGLRERGRLTWECRSEACNGAVGLSDGFNGNGRVELADKPTLCAVIRLNVEGGREDKVARVTACSIDLFLGGKSARPAEARDRCSCSFARSFGAGRCYHIRYDAGDSAQDGRDNRSCFRCCRYGIGRCQTRDC